MATVTRRVRQDLNVAERRKVRRSIWQVRLSVQLSVLAAVVLGLWALWNFTATPVEIVVDGVAETVHTHRRAVGALLADVGLLLGPEEAAENLKVGRPPSLTRLNGTNLPDGVVLASLGDYETQVGQRGGLWLSHSLDERIENGLRVTVERPRPFRITADGREIVISSWAGTLPDLLADAGIAFDRHDQVIINDAPGTWDEAISSGPVQLSEPLFGQGRAWDQIDREPLPIEINRSYLLTVDDGSIPYTIRTMAETVGEALRDAEITIYLGDHVQPSLGTPVSTGLRVRIQRSTPISLFADGRLHKTRSLSHTVGDALTEIGVGLSGLDEVLPSLDAPLYPDMQITILRVVEEIDLEEEFAPYETIFVGDPNLLIDTRHVSPGAEGITRRRYRIRFEDGQEVARTLEDVWVAQQPRQHVISYGQKIVPQTFVNEAGEEIVYWRKMRMRATSYSASTAGVPTSVPWYGITRTGDVMRKGVVAVDPKLIPLRSKVYVPGYGYGDALDTGNAIQSKRIDLGYDDHNLELWRKWVDVYLLWPPPPEHQIVWLVPNSPIEQ